MPQQYHPRHGDHLRVRHERIELAYLGMSAGHLAYGAGAPYAAHRLAVAVRLLQPLELGGARDGVLRVRGLRDRRWPDLHHDARLGVGSPLHLGPGRCLHARGLEPSRGELLEHSDILSSADSDHLLLAGAVRGRCDAVCHDRAFHGRRLLARVQHRRLGRPIVRHLERLRADRAPHENGVEGHQTGQEIRFQDLGTGRGIAREGLGDKAPGAGA
mmetsp:Transcript_29244/g.84003  ORF Transcript_29244/g.84003 Transcript_29244/m.84003 type:complete len:215 (-) Transcript_29244:1042-1686(-)